MSPIISPSRFSTATLGLVLILVLADRSTSQPPTADGAAKPKASSDADGARRQAAAVEGSTSETPIGSGWRPSRWGADDQRGAANLMTAERVLEATKLIKTGKTYQLGRVYERDMPTFPFRTFRLTIPAFRASTRGDNQQVGRDELGYRSGSASQQTATD